ncbi:DUF2785 domain-containing protein [Virgibacillus sp. FSP13]
MNDLKHQLLEIRANEYNFANHNLDDLSLEMIKNIGTTDFVLRDELIYTTFAQMILIKDLLDQNQLNQLLGTCLDEWHLFYGLGEKENDSVFARAFSVLVLALVLDADNRQSFLSEGEFNAITDKTFDYFNNERDIRGYVKGKGWAHALAHAADTLNVIANHSYFTGERALNLLKIIRSKVIFSDSVYCYNEDERMALPVLSVFKSGLLSDQQVVNWISDFRSQLEEQKKIVSDPDGLNLLLNVRNFLSSLYFRLKFEKIRDHFQREIENTLNSIRGF